MTEKLYYTTPYETRFEARVISCVRQGDAWLAVLERTLFYPEGGGQPADHGTLGGRRVLDVHERGDDVVHTLDGPLREGELVEGLVDWPRRFSLMQHHSAEHMVSGTVHRLFGFDNVGFHMGGDCVTMDFSGPLEQSQLDEVEDTVNRGIWENRALRCFYPGREALGALSYRSKKELDGEVRLVEVPEYDLCACCGLHVARTGEIGLVKLTGSQRYKGGTRVSMLCGERALADYRERNAQARELSALYSARVHEIVPAAARVLAERDEWKARCAALERELFARRAEAYAGRDTVCVIEEGLSPAGCRLFGEALMARCGLAVVLGGSEGARCYAVASASCDVRPIVKEANAALMGRGGGNAQLAQGSFAAPDEAIKEHFKRKEKSCESAG
ncbi:alanyl-tRNA editing protein [Feifania hominis]|uniref:Alanyl-tRNA editing protein n=1 Tax=Feifania hominis TaxID=2763660 RepID=A0A926DFB7_9FIRM|nr:alanyl-tRNA editing protein [Feifania hominis]MBC8535980.1 alanyl-tRNA editing protein [Feifania hominis]